MRLIYSIDVPYACFGLIAEGDSEERAIVVESPPIANWCTGKSLKSVLDYWRKKNAKIVLASKKASNPMSEEEPLFKKEPKEFHVSVSSIQRFLQCPLSYKFHYIDHKRPPKSDILNFGTWVHACLESVFKWVILQEHFGRVPVNVISKVCSEESKKAGGAELEVYNEGLELVSDYFKLNQDIDHNRILSVEKEFRIVLPSGVDLVGVIDRLEREDDDTILVVDYKTNRMLYAEDELEANLQMSTYGIAVEHMWPSVKTVKYRFDMLRHCKELAAVRTREELSQALDYLSAMSLVIVEAKEFPAKTNQFCPWCDHRDYCDEFQALLKKDPDKFSYKDNIESRCEAREQVSAIERDAKRKRQDIEREIRAYMRKQDVEKLDVDGLRYVYSHQEEQIYLLEQSFNTINKALDGETGEKSKEIFNELVMNSKLDHKQLMEFVETLPLDRTKKARLKFDLERQSTKRKRNGGFLMAMKIK